MEDKEQWRIAEKKMGLAPVTSFICGQRIQWLGYIRR